METKHKPATPLPWQTNGETQVLGARLVGLAQIVAEINHDADATYIVHSANAYQRLVEALRELHAIDERKLKASEQRVYKIGHSKIQERVERNRALLRELGGGRMKPLDEHDPYFDLSGEQGLGEEEPMPVPSWHFVLLAIALGLVMALVV